MATLLRTGVRVVRGPDWPSPSSEDGGEGFVGTVVEVPPLDSAGGNAAAADRPSSSQLDSVTVQWDVGTRGSYRCGTEGKYDLRILDTAQAGKIISMHRVGTMISGCTNTLTLGYISSGETIAICRYV